MEVIRQWALTACFAVAASGLITMIVPKNQLGKVMGLTTSIFILLCFLLPVSNANCDFDKWDVSLPKDESNEIADKIDKISKNYVYEQASDNIYIMIDDALAQLGVRAENIEVEIKNAGEATEIAAHIYINEIYYSAISAVKNKLENMGITTTVVLCDDTETVDERNEK